LGFSLSDSFSRATACSVSPSSYSVMPRSKIGEALLAVLRDAEIHPRVDEVGLRLQRGAVLRLRLRVVSLLIENLADVVMREGVRRVALERLAVKRQRLIVSAGAVRLHAAREQALGGFAARDDAGRRMDFDPVRGDDDADEQRRKHEAGQRRRFSDARLR
jgi:hypothetical protein